MLKIELSPNRLATAHDAPTSVKGNCARSTEGTLAFWTSHCGAITVVQVDDRPALRSRAVDLVGDIDFGQFAVPNLKSLGIQDQLRRLCWDRGSTTWLGTECGESSLVLRCGVGQERLEA